MSTHPKSVFLLDSASHVRYADIVRDFPSDVCVCDLYVCGAETGAEIPGGYQLRRVMNIDHHAPVARMARRVSSANLAIEQVTKFGIPSGPVVINHTDCDSILSAGIAAGRLQPLQEYGDAAIAADHTGAVNSISDLLQGLDESRNTELSFRNLELLLCGLQLEGVAQDALDLRTRKRAAAEAAVVARLLQTRDGLAYGVLDDAIDGEFFPDLLRDAAVILIASRLKTMPGRWEMKLRLGHLAPDGFTLESLRITEWDPAYGGRWNAGSNKRGNGTIVTPEVYAERVLTRLKVETRQVAAIVPALSQVSVSDLF